MTVSFDDRYAAQPCMEAEVGHEKRNQGVCLDASEKARISSPP
jgi:hypothetical protein